MHGINIVLYKYSTICFLLCIKKSGPSVINKEPISFYLPRVLKGEEMGVGGNISAVSSVSIFFSFCFDFYFCSILYLCS